MKRAIENSDKLDFTKSRKYTLSQWLNVWYENYAQIKMRLSSYLTYGGYIKNRIKPYVGDIPMEKLTFPEL